MKKLLIFIFLLPLNFLHTQLSPSSFLKTVTQLPQTNTNNMIEHLTNYFSYVDWTEGTLVTEFCIPITYNDKNIGRNNHNLTDKLKERIIQYMLGAIPKIRLSSSFTLHDIFQRHQNIKLNTLSLVYARPLENTIITNSKIKGRMTLSLFGTNSISSLLYKNITQQKITNYLQKETTGTQIYDTLIIDTIMFPHFNPSISPSILDLKGNVIHSVSTVDPKILSTHNSVHFVTSITEALHHPATGSRVAYILPDSINGTLSTDITLFQEDVQKIFGQQRTLNNLKQGNIIIIIPKK